MERGISFCRTRWVAARGREEKVEEGEEGVGG